MTRPRRVDVPVDPARLAAWRQAAAGQPLAAFLREAGDREAERRAEIKRQGTGSACVDVSGFLPIIKEER